MKKQTKIFAILLTLALVIGVFAIGASAYGHDYAADAAEPVAGEKFISYSNFNNAVVQTYANNASINANTGSGKKVQVANLSAPTTVEAFASAYDSTDRYIQIYNSTAAAASNSFYLNLNTDVPTTSTGMSASDFQSKFHDAGYTLAERQYQVLDFDIFFPTGSISIAPTIGFEFRAFNSSGARKDLRANAGDKLGYLGTNYTIKIQQSGDDILLKAMNGYSSSPSFDAGVALEKNEWSHVTMIIEGVLVDRGTTDPSDDGIAIRCYTMLNGTLIGTHTIDAPDTSYASKYLSGDMTGIYCNQVKFNAVNLGAGDKIQVDNIALRAYDREAYDDTQLAAILAEGVGADFTQWDGNSYVAEDMPHGNLMAELDGVKYGNLAAAIADAPAGATIELKNSYDSKIVIDKALTINLNGNAIPNLATAPGFAVSKTDDQIVITKATSALTVLWYECECGEGCIEEIEVDVYSGNNIYDSYKAATGKDPICKGMLDGLNMSKHVGFEDVSGCIEEFDETIVVDADLLGETIELVPIYEEDSVIAIRIDAKGNETAIFASQGFKGSSLNISKGITIKLMTDVEMTKENRLAISVADVTFDLNGHKLISLTEGTSNPDNRYNIFTVNADGFTIKSSEVGGAIYHVTKSAAGAFNGMAVVSGSKNDATVYFEGQNEAGETTLSIYAAQIFQAWSTTTSFSVKGGNYVATGAYDGTGVFYARTAASSYTIEDAYLDGGNAVISFAAYNQTGITCQVNVKNCVFGNSKPASTYTFDGLTINFEDCYFGNEVQPRSILNGATAPADAKATYVFKNCFVKEGVVIDGTYAEGQGAHKIDMTKEWTISKNTWDKTKWGDKEALLALSDTTVSMHIDTMITDADLKPVNVIWYAADGETVLAESTALPGSNASCPTTEVEGSEGYVVSTYVDWTKDTYIPLGTTGTVSFTLKEGAGAVLQAGKIGIMFNFDMVNHLQYNHYIPEAPEGITYKAITIGGAAKSLGTKIATDPATGIKYHTINSWPGINSSDSAFGCEVVFEFEGKEYTYSAPTMDIPKYVTYILTNEKYEESDKLRTAMADLIRFLKTAKESQTGTTVRASLTAAYNVALPFMSEATTAIDTTATADLGAVDAYVDSIKLVFHTSLSGVTVQADTKDGYAAVIAGVVSPVHGMNVIGDTRFVNGMYNGHNIRSWAMLNELKVTIYKVEDTTVNTSNVVTVNEGAEAVATATFSVEGLINADTGANEKTIAFYQASCAYAKSGKAYVDWLKS